MSDNLERMQVAQWILERNLHWISAAEVKTGVVVAIDTAMLGALATAFSGLVPAERTALACVFTVISGCCLILAVFSAAMSIVPRVTGPRSSFIFFRRIIEAAEPDYVSAFCRATEKELLEDCLAQIHRNAEIACDKFKWVRAGMMWSFVAVLPWAIALGSLVRT